MAQFMVTAAELRSKAEQLQQLNEQFKQLTSTLRDQENGLSGMWEGEARDTFRTAFQGSAGKMDDFSATIMQYVNGLQDIIRQYEQAEAKNVETATVKA